MDKKILVVEDDKGARETLASLLKHKYAVITAEDGQEGLELWMREADVLALVISDYAMPRLNGDDMIKTARSLQLRTPTIIFSGVDRECEPDTICLRKIFDQLKLFELVADIMSRPAA